MADKRVRVVEVMALRRIHLPHPLGGEGQREFERAKRRCLACRVTKLCDEALSKADVNGLSLFCPNNHYLQHLRNASLAFW
jgi:hypothetical protein